MRIMVKDREFYKKIGKIGLENRWKKEHSKFRIKKYWSKEKAAIDAFLCGDGYIAIRKDKNGTIHHEAQIVLDNFELCSYVCNLFKKEFKINLNTSKRKDNCFGVRINNKPICSHLLSLNKYKSMEWKIPFGLNETELREWIKCFCDCESSVDIKRRKIQVKSINHNGLYEIKKALKSFKINSNLYGPYKQKIKRHRDYSILVISSDDVIKYKKLINFNHPLKKEKLARIA